MRKIEPIIFCGSASYCAKRLKELKSQGWKVIKHREWCDGRHSYVMQHEGN